MDEGDAATKLQAIKRGQAARELTQQRKDAADVLKRQQEAQAHVNASAVLSAGARGYSQRRAAKKQEEELAKSSVRIQAKFRGKKERADPGAEVNVRRERSKNDPQVQSAAYLKQHNIMELFEMLGQMLVSEKPEDPRTFLVDQLERLNAVVDRTSPMNFFDEDDIGTLYSMYNVSNRGMTAAQCREALDTLGLKSVKVPAGSTVDLDTFKSLVPAALPAVA